MESDIDVDGSRDSSRSVGSNVHPSAHVWTTKYSLFRAHWLNA